MKILLVDDEKEFVSTLAERMHFRGIEAEDVNNGADAIEKVKKNEYDVIVLDLKMAGLNGIETMKKIKEIRPDSSFIILTGHLDVDELQKCRDEGACECMVKPLDIENLIEKINNIGKGGK